MFQDRHDAGRRLAAELVRFKDRNPVVLALARGGVAVGFEVALALEAALDVVLVRKIGAPFQPELAIGAVVDGREPEVLTNEDLVRLLGVSNDYVRSTVDAALAEIERRRAVFSRGRPAVDLAGRTAIVVDDGIATGATTQAALRSVGRRRPAHVVLAVPVAPPDAIAALAAEADEIVCLHQAAAFGAIGAFYRDFRQLTDDDVIDLLDRARVATRAATGSTM